MNVQKVLQSLQCIRADAVDAQSCIEGGDSDGAYDLLEDIVRLAGKALDEIDAPLHPEK